MNSKMNSQGFKVAIVGATGNVGREMLNILEERGFPVSEVVALASRRSLGTEVSFGDRTLKCKVLEMRLREANRAAGKGQHEENQ